MADSIRFAEKKLNFHDLSNEMILTSDRLNTKNYDELRNEYPDIKYVIAIFEHAPKIKKEKGSGFEYVGPVEKQTRREYISYTTTLGVSCEIMLFDLTNNQLIAKSEKVFEDGRTRKIYQGVRGNILLKQECIFISS